MDVPHSRVLITGAGTGIGAATARVLARRGDELALHHHLHRSEAESLAKELVAAGGRAFTVPGDLTSTKDLDRMVQTLGSHFPSLEGLVLNAGAYPRTALEKISDEQFEATVRLNLFSPFALTRRLLPLLRKASPSPARVVLVSSILAFNGSAHGADYAASKAGILGLARSLARELAPGITVNVVAPGSIDTAILAEDTPAQREARGRQIPLGRVGSPEEVARVVAFLTSPDANYMTGTTVHVNGGLRMD